MLRIEKYTLAYKVPWDQFIDNSKNGIFLFNRDYMEYHSDRFTDHSLLFYDGQELVAVLPANIKDDTLYSHAGLTFGGIISNNKMKIHSMLETFSALKEYLKRGDFKKVIYKAIPHIYHTIPAEEDLYTLFLNDIKLIKRDLSTTIFMEKNAGFSERRKRCLRKCKMNGLKVTRSYDYKTFTAILEKILKEKHMLKPTHTAGELELLANRFPENIKLFISHHKDNMTAGVIIYESRNVAHAQYIASTNEGKKISALDLVFDYLINEYYAEKKYFDFGISTEKSGFYLNSGLVAFKEEFGARTIVYDTYEMDIK